MHNTHMHNTHKSLYCMLHGCTQNYYTGAHTRTHGHTRTSIAHAGTQVLVLLFILPNVDEQSQFIGDSDSDGPVRSLAAQGSY